MNLHGNEKQFELFKAATAVEQGKPLYWPLTKGDVAGHAFHGNQYKDGGTKAKEAHAATTKANSSGLPEDHRFAANKHELAMQQAIPGHAQQAHNEVMHAHNAAAKPPAPSTPHDELKMHSEAIDYHNKLARQYGNMRTTEGRAHMEASQAHAVAGYGHKSGLNMNKPLSEQSQTQKDAAAQASVLSAKANAMQSKQAAHKPSKSAAEYDTVHRVSEARSDEAHAKSKNAARSGKAVSHENAAKAHDNAGRGQHDAAEASQTRDQETAHKLKADDHARQAQEHRARARG